MKFVMVDMETLGTTADSVIVSIGAVKFDEKNVDDGAFYTPISVDSNLALGRRISESTLAWWMQQPDAARAVFNAPAEVLPAALESFADWFDHGDYLVWSNGASFDIPMLEHAFAQCQITTPWKFWNSRCFRTVKNLFCAKKVPSVAPALAHHALHDAIAQAKTLQAIWKSANEKTNVL